MTTTPPRQPNVKNGREPLDTPRPFMDDKRLSISVSSPRRSQLAPRATGVARGRRRSGRIHGAADIEAIAAPPIAA